MPKWITTRRAIELTGYSPKHIRRLVQSGKVAGQKFGNTWQIGLASLLSYVRKVGKTGAKRGPKTEG